MKDEIFFALNGGPLFKFNESLSFMVHCETQEEVDYYWGKLSEGGDDKAQRCGWLKDKYEVSRQIVLIVLDEMLQGVGAKKSEKVREALLRMKKLDIETLKMTYKG